MIMIVDYGLGNVQAIANIYVQLNVEAEVVKSADRLDLADKIVLPGVGSFDWAMECLSASGMVECLRERVVSKKCPVLGICVGMQIMGRRSEEGRLNGLGWIDADVKRFDNNGSHHPVQLPHMGWNDVVPRRTNDLFRGLDAPQYYFLHSYYFKPRNDADALATTNYHGFFPSAVCSNHIFGVQFHPEKSHAWGVRLLKNFAEL